MTNDGFSIDAKQITKVGSATRYQEVLTSQLGCRTPNAPWPGVGQLAPGCPPSFCHLRMVSGRFGSPQSMQNLYPCMSAQSIYNRNLNESNQIKSNKIISTQIIQTLSSTIQSIDPLSVSVFGVCVCLHYVVHHAWAYSFGWMRIKVALVVVSTCRLVNS